MFSRLQNKASALEPAQFKPWMLLVIVVLAIFAIASQLWSSYQSFNHQPVYQSSRPPVTQSHTGAYNIGSITGSNLFGSGAANDRSASTLLPATQLNLILRGAFTSSNPKHASAIIQGPDGETRSFKIDSQVYNNARLQAVFSDRIVLSRDGELETLYFPEPGTETPTANDAVASSNATSVDAYNVPDDIVSLVKNNMTAAEIQQTSQQLQSKSMSQEQRQALIKKRLQDLRDRARKSKDNNR